MLDRAFGAIPFEKLGNFRQGLKRIAQKRREKRGPRKGISPPVCGRLRIHRELIAPKPTGTKLPARVARFPRE